MIIKLSPVEGIGPLAIKKRGDVLTINEEQFDFGGLPEGASLPASAVACEYVSGDITRTNGDLVITFLLPCADDASEAAKFPADIVNPPDGTVSLPQ